jgi:hypothetical protein
MKWTLSRSLYPFLIPTNTSSVRHVTDRDEKDGEILNWPGNLRWVRKTQSKKGSGAEMHGVQWSLEGEHPGTS